MGAASVTFILLCLAGCLSYGSSSREVQRIFGGTEVDLQRAPYMVLVKRDGEDTCGGAIISESWVVTAAHCFDTTPARERARRITVCSGSSYRRNCIVNTVADVIIHEHYNETRAYNNDIAIVLVTPPFNFNNGNLPIALPSPGESDVLWGTICGWGSYQIYPNGTAIPGFSEQLRCAQVPLINCPISYAAIDTMVCYGYQQGGVDSCPGDSGGPLSFNSTLYGIISRGYDCGYPDLPSLNTKVTQFVGWIKSKTGIN